LLELGLKTLIAYLMGSVVGALLIGQFRGVDIRTMGSGNAGGTNALRTQGLGFAAATVVIDIGKGWLAAGWLPGLAIPGVALDPAIARDWLAACCAAGAVAGHVWPLWHDFRGGKGGATLAGTLMALAPMLLALAVTAWVAILLLTAFVDLRRRSPRSPWPSPPSSRRAHPLRLRRTRCNGGARCLCPPRKLRAHARGTEPRVLKLWLFRPREDAR
jgi:glycerol-3-phosphate acyltransferase PlsY